jgi:ubiquinone/menaquinone biosynthesis C-methylase UbiE
MLKHAKREDGCGDYVQFNGLNIPYEDNSFEVVFSSLVFLELKSLQQISEINRIMVPGGLFILITGTTDVYDVNNKWLTVNNDCIENKAPNSGDIVKLLLSA